MYVCMYACMYVRMCVCLCLVAFSGPICGRVGGMSEDVKRVQGSRFSSAFFTGVGGGGSGHLRF